MSALTARVGVPADALDDGVFDDETPPGMELCSLAERPILMPWRLDPDPDPAKPSRKVPYSVNGGGQGKVSDAATWGTRRQAQKRADVLLKGGRAGGVGLVLGRLPDGAGACIGGIDLDTCRDPKTGTLDGWAADILQSFPSYAEVSPSGTGVKVYFTYDVACLPSIQAALGRDTMGKSFKRGTGQHPPAIELFLGKRWFAVTGQQLADSPAELKPVPAATVLRLIRKDGPAFAGSRDDFEAALDQSPDLCEWGKNARNVERAWNGKSDGLGDIEGLNLNQDGLARAFTGRHPDTRYDVDEGCWFRFNGNHWAAGKRGLAFHFARLLTRDLIQSGQLADTVGSRSMFDDIETIARRDPAHEVDSSVWNPDKSCAGTPERTIETVTGTLRIARKEDMITKLTAVSPVPLAEFDPDLDCPKWLAFLNQATGNDAALIRFLQQFCGYCLTGLTTEHALVFIYGPGGNGKSVFINIIRDIMGDYATTTGMDVFSASKTDRHPQELARLAGVRLVCASETTEGRAWDEARIKTMTGGDPITARFMRQNDFTFQPQFKLLIAGNNKPALRHVDDAMRRRINIVPFINKPENPDPQLEEKLRDERAAILSWMIAGCLDWRANRLVKPKVVVDATAEYFDAQDTFGQWLQERCEFGRAYATPTAELMADWVWFAQSSGEANSISSPRTFADRLRARGFEPAKNLTAENGKRGRGFKGLRLMPTDTAAGSEDGL